ncbi:MAG: protein kinase [Gemmataceae bacterium]|nr:protein kinase [Gemmataceae bacterium]
MANPNADRNLLYGVLALQMEFVTREQMVTALSAWGHAKDKSLGQILMEHGVLHPERQLLLDGLVNVRLQQHGNDVEQSLMALALPPALRDELLQLADPEMQASVSRIPAPAAPAADEFATHYGVAGVATQPKPPKAERTQIADPKAADPHATNIAMPGAGTQQEPAKAADPHATMAGSASKTHPDIDLAAPAPSSTAPSRSRFSVIRSFARGGLGEVLLAEDEELKREVALKQIQTHHADDLESRARFLLEAEVTGKLEHPGIVPVYGLNQYSDGRPYYAMRFIRGESLKDAIDRFHKETADADPSERTRKLHHLLRRFYDVCQAIAYAHSRGILHRDIKPANVMLGTFGETYVVDWGLAKPVDRPDLMPENPHQKRVTLSGTASATPTLMGAAVGTPQYMSPEQAAGQLDKLGPPSDVYSLGASLYVLLTGTAAISDTDLVRLLDRVKKGDFRKPRAVKPDIHPALEAICVKAMALKPEDRYPTPRELARDIELWLADEPVSAWPEPWTVKTWRWVKRHRTLVSTAAAAVVLITVGSIIFAGFMKAAAERERELKVIAENNYRMAREAVDRYDTHVSEDLLLHEPDMKPLRQKLLADAGDFYEKFVDARKDEPNVEGELGRARYRLGKITADIESRDAAIALLKQAADTFEKDEAAYRSDLADCYHHLGRLHRLSDDLAKSEEMYQKALKQWESLGGAREADLAGWARTQQGIGNLYQHLRRFDKARLEYDKAQANWGTLVAKQPKSPEYRRYQGVAHFSLGMVYLQVENKLAQARSEFAKAIAIQQPLSKQHPNLSQVQSDLAASHFYLGEAHLLANQRHESVTSYEAAARVYERLTQTHPSELAFRTRLVLTLSAIANACVDQGKSKEAIKASERALEVQRELADSRAAELEHRGDLALRYVEHADVLRRAGQMADAAKAYQAALAMQKQLTQEKTDTPRYWADLARSYNGVGGLHLKQNKEAEAEADFSRALEIWEKLQAERPESAEFARGIAATCENLRVLSRSPGNYRVALAPLDRVIGVYAAAVQARPEPALKHALFHSHWARAEARTAHALGMESPQDSRDLYLGALQDWDQAVNLAASGKDKLWVRIYRAITRARYGDTEQAVKEADDVIKLAKLGADAQFQLARAFALAALAESKKSGAGAAEARKRAEQYADRATQFLDQARTAGFFARPEHGQRLRDEPDWQFLRTRETFQAWLRDLKPAAAMP